MAPERKRSSREDPPRVYLDRGVYKGDFRRWGRGRVTLRDPEDPHGEPTQNPGVALRWALAYVDQFRDETESRQLKRGPKPCSLGEAAAAFFEKRSVSRPTTTAEGNRSALNALRRFAATDRESGRKGDQLATNRITPDFLQRFFDKLAADGYAAGTLIVYRQALSAFLRDVGYGDKNAALRVDLAQVVHEEVATWTEDALAAIRDAADALDRERTDFLNHRLAVELALASGARRNELFALGWERISEVQRTVRITQQLHKNNPVLVHPKGRKPRTALLLPSWWEHHRKSTGLILPAPHGGLMHPPQLVFVATRILTRAGLYRPGAGWHSFRHTYSRDFVELGGRFEELQKSLGHASIVTTEKLYGHFHEDVAAALAGARIYRDRGLRAV